MATFVLIYLKTLMSTWSLRHETGLKYFTDRSKAVLLLWIFYVFVLSCVCYVLCASVYMCFVVTCWERADLLALVCGVYCEFVTFPLVSWVRCGTWLYRFLIFAPLLTFFNPSSKIIVLTVPRRCFFVDNLCYFCLVFFMLSHLFIAALWSPARKGLTSRLSFVI